jgi:hypothetical protein
MCRAKNLARSFRRIFRCSQRITPATERNYCKELVRKTLCPFDADAPWPRSSLLKALSRGQRPNPGRGCTAHLLVFLQDEFAEICIARTNLPQ